MKRPWAVFTIAQDEPRFLPVWLRYYTGQTVEARDCYVLDHVRTVDPLAAVGTVRAFGAVHVPVENDLSFDHRWLLETVKRFQRFLFQSYEVVLFSEVDELVMRADGDSLDEYVRNRMAADVVAPVGMNVMQANADGPLDWEKPILAQRRYAYVAPRYTKPLLARVPVEWDIGFHGPAVPPDPNLLNVHLHRVDLAYCLERHERATARNWSQYDRENGLGVQYHRFSPDEVTKWFYHGGDRGETLVELPAAIRGAV